MEDEMIDCIVTINNEQIKRISKLFETTIGRKPLEEEIEKLLLSFFVSLNDFIPDETFIEAILEDYTDEWMRFNDEDLYPEKDPEKDDELYDLMIIHG